MMGAALCEKCVFRGAHLPFKANSLSTIIAFWPSDELGDFFSRLLVQQIIWLLFFSLSMLLLLSVSPSSCCIPLGPHCSICVCVCVCVRAKCQGQIGRWRGEWVQRHTNMHTLNLTLPRTHTQTHTLNPPLSCLVPCFSEGHSLKPDRRDVPKWAPKDIQLLITSPTNQSVSDMAKHRLL